MKGLCFSGGGIKAAAHIGALKALEEDILTKLEDLRLASCKKFAERIETVKNINTLYTTFVILRQTPNFLTLPPYSLQSGINGLMSE